MPQQDVFAHTDAKWWEGGQKIKAGETFQPRKLNTPLDKLTRQRAGRRSLTKTERKHGRYIKARPAGNKTDDIAFDATFVPRRRSKSDASKNANGWLLPSRNRICSARYASSAWRIWFCFWWTLRGPWQLRNA